MVCWLGLKGRRNHTLEPLSVISWSLQGYESLIVKNLKLGLGGFKELWHIAVCLYSIMCLVSYSELAVNKEIKR